MSLPNIYFVKAILESYLNMRKDLWNMVDPTTGVLNFPAEDSVQGQKLEVCKKILQRVSRHHLTVDEWIATAEMLNDMETASQKGHDERSFIVKFFVAPPLLKPTLSAVRSYIISAMAADDDFIAYMQNLVTERHNLEADIAIKSFHKYPRHEIAELETNLVALKKKQTLLTENADYIHTFYKDHINLEDPDSVKLKEKHYEDFITNINKGFRSAPICDELLKIIRAHDPEPLKSILKNSNKTSSRRKGGDTKSALRSNSTFETTSATAPRRSKSSNRVGFDESKNQVTPVSQYINKV